MLSIVYITCNRSAELEKSVLSCERSISMCHEYVIVDNGSTDDTKVVMSKLLQNGLPIRYLLQDKNYGVAGGRNIGFREAKGDICYFIDDDASIISEGFVLDRAYDYIKNDDSIMAMGTDCYDTERKCQLIGLAAKGAVKNSESSIISYIGCSHFIKKTAVTTPYLYPNNLMYGSEEGYAGRAIYRRGGRVAHYPYLKILHEPSRSVRSSWESRKRDGHVNIYVIKRYFLPYPYSALSTCFFFLRILRFEHGSFRKVAEDFRLVKQRINREYVQKFTLVQTQKLVRLFGLKQII